MQKVDPTPLPRTVVMLRSEPQKLAGIDQYLKSRGFTLTLVSKLSDAVQIITEKRPDFALLQTDMVPPRSGWLFGILSQLTAVILYAERISAKTLIVTRELKGAYLLEPPLSPMGLERMLRRVERDHARQTQEAAQLTKAHVTIMSTLSELALRSVCIPGTRGSGTGAEVIGQVSRVTCFRVQTRLMAGYFVMAHGQSRLLDAAWTERLQGELRRYLETLDETPSLDPGAELEIEEVQFNRWTKEQAEFIRSATHQEAELVVAFFRDAIQLQKKDSDKSGHVEISLDHLIADTKVDFDIYIYLPQNARFVLYTPRGGTLFATQKEKLISEGIQSVHIDKRSLDMVLRHRAHNFIRESTAALR